MIALRSISKLRLVAVVVAAAVALILSTATSAAQTFPLYVVSYTETVPANVSQIDDAGTVLPVALVPGKPNTVVEDDSGNLYVCRSQGRMSG